MTSAFVQPKTLVYDVSTEWLSEVRRNGIVPGNLSGFLCLLSDRIVWPSLRCTQKSKLSYVEQQMMINWSQILPMFDTEIKPTDLQKIEVYQANSRVVIKNTSSDNLYINEPVYAIVPRPKDIQIQETVWPECSERGHLIATTNELSASHVLAVLADSFTNKQCTTGQSVYKKKSFEFGLCKLIDNLMHKDFLFAFKRTIGDTFAQDNCFDRLSEYTNHYRQHGHNINSEKVGMCLHNILDSIKHISAACPKKIGIVRRTLDCMDAYTVSPGNSFEIELFQD